MKSSNLEMDKSIETRRQVSRVGELRREKLIALKQWERRESDTRQPDRLYAASKK